MSSSSDHLPPIPMTEYAPLFPAFMEQASYWEEVILLAQADKLIRRIEEEKTAPPGLWAD